MIVVIYKSGMTGFKNKEGLVQSLKNLKDGTGTKKDVRDAFEDQIEGEGTYRDKEILKLLKQS